MMIMMTANATRGGIQLCLRLTYVVDLFNDHFAMAGIINFFSLSYELHGGRYFIRCAHYCISDISSYLEIFVEWSNAYEWNM